MLPFIWNKSTFFTKQDNTVIKGFNTNHQKEPSYTLVTAFFNIKRNQWKSYNRSLDTYFNNAKRVFSLDDYMVIYIEPEYVSFVEEERKKYKDKTKIIPITLDQLPYYKYKNDIQEIMESNQFKIGLADPTVPEVNEPLYDVIIWSKVPLVVKTIEENPFNTSHFGWIDFGSHPHMLQDSMLNKPLLSNVSDLIQIGCRSYPSTNDLNIKLFYKSHQNRFVANLFTGSAENFKLLNKYFDEEVHNALNEKVVDCEQSLFAVVFLKHPELFKLHYGDFGQMISNYHGVTQNLATVLHIALTARNEGQPQVIEDVINNLGTYNVSQWGQ